MGHEAELIAALRRIATEPEARGLLDDAAVLDMGETKLVFTHDMIVEDVHFLPSDPAGDVAWKLLAVNLSDLAAKGARPVGVLLGYGLRKDAVWNAEFVEGLSRALSAFGVALLGGDTVALPADGPRTFGLTAIGAVTGVVPSRSGARPGDIVWVSGTIGDARAGLRIARSERGGPDSLLERYRTPRPRLEAGQRLGPIVSAMMDVSDGLLLDSGQLAAASGVRAVLELESLPISADYLTFAGEDRGARMSAATAGDDYELLFTTPEDRAVEVLALSEELGLPLSRIGRIEKGSGLQLLDRGEDVPLPAQLGYEH